MREIRGWNIGEVVTANEMTLNSANIYEEVGSNGEPNLPCIYNGLTLQSQSGSGNSIVTFNPGVCRCQDLPISTYTYLPSNAYGTGYPCFIDISVLDSNTVITLTTTPSPGYIVATFTINPTSSGAVNYVITGSLLQIAIGSYNPAIHVRLCKYTYTGSTFTLDFTPKVSRDTDFTGLGGIQWNYQNSSLVIDVPSSQSGSSIVLNQPVIAASNFIIQGTCVVQSGDSFQFYNAANTHYTSLQAGANTSNYAAILPIVDGTPGQGIVTNGSGQWSFSSISSNPATYNSAGTITREAVWTAYSPSFSSGFGSVTDVNTFWKVLGDTLFVSGAFTLGLTTGTVGTISLPSGFTINVATSPIPATPGNIIGFIACNSSGAGQIGLLLSYPSASATQIYTGPQLTGSTLLNQAGPSSIFTNNTPVSFNFQVPIV